MGNTRLDHPLGQLHRDSEGQSCLGPTNFALPAHQYSLILTRVQLTLSLILVYQISLVFTKMSILFLYLRILTYHHARWAVYALMAVVIIYNLWGIISELTVCTPLEKLFQMEEYDACHPVSFTWASVALHIATDFLIFFLPIPVFFRLKMPAREKITVVILFSLGFL